MWNCTHFRHSTVEQLQHIDVSSNNNLLSIAFELTSFRQPQSPSPVGLVGLWCLSHIDGYMRHNKLSNDIWILVHNTLCNISIHFDRVKLIVSDSYVLKQELSHISTALQHCEYAGLLQL